MIGMDALGVVISILFGLLFLAVFGGVFGFLVFATWKGKKARAALEARRAAATPGRATVVASRAKQHGGGIDGAVSVATSFYLTLDIETANGPVRGEAVWDVDVSKMQLLADGAVVDVLIDSTDPRFVFPAVPWAKQSGLDPIHAASQPGAQR